MIAKEKYIELLKHLDFNYISNIDKKIYSNYFKILKGSILNVTYIGTSENLDIFSLIVEDENVMKYGIDELEKYFISLFPAEMRKYKIKNVLNEDYIN